MCSSQVNFAPFSLRSRALAFLILDWDSFKLEKISKELHYKGVTHYTATLRDGISIGETCKQAGVETFLLEPVLLRGNVRCVYCALAI